MKPTPEFAIVYKNQIPYTNAPEILGGGAMYQIYKEEQDALNFLEFDFSDAEYEIRPVIVFDMTDVHLDQSND